MELRLSKNTVKHIAIGGIVCILVYWLINETEHVQTVTDWIMGILSPFIIGSVLAFILNVPMRAIEKALKWIKNDKLRRTVALVLTLIGFALVLTVVFLLLIPQLHDTISNQLIPELGKFLENVGISIDKFLTDNPEVMTWLSENTDLKSFDWGTIAQKVLGVVSTGLSAILEQTVFTISKVASGVMNIFIAIVFAIYALFQKEVLARQGRRLLYAFLPEKAADYIIRTVRLSSATFSNFLSGQCIEVCILGSMFAISMAILGMDYIPLISVLVAVTAFIPIVGAWIGCIVGAFLLLVADPMQAVIFVIMFLVLQQIEGNLIYPHVVGASIGLSGMWVLVAVAFGGELMGIAGMFLMIPIVSVLYTLLSEWTANRLQKREVAGEKLVAHPPQMQSKRKERREKKKKAKANTAVQASAEADKND